MLGYEFDVKRISTVKHKRKKNRENPPERVQELKKKINDPVYLSRALNRMADELCELFFDD